ncbi:hypothetical protein RN001_013789 [Aquatica leii]|uniref:Thymidylate kinase n=1 Tax=Aquatica leii TaxID=1421715 RepID=A0AAN7PR27_9COLE|nr:hypothetical protein RN001_013789 [Aquatica leii]
MTRGAFIVVEGVDRCGKTSQTMKLVESLQQKNIKAERMAFPDRTTWTGQVISNYLADKNCKLNDQAIHLLFTANRWENVEKMKEKLSSGITLVVDRYFYSGVAFSAAKGMSIDWCLQPEIGLLKPDKVLFLRIKSDTQKSRPGFGEERYETSVMQQKVNKIYDKFSQSEDNWKIIDANSSFDEVHEDLLNNIVESVQNVANSNAPFKYLLNHCNKEDYTKNV